MADTAKLQKFVEAAITNPKHPVYEAGMRHSAILQHYHLNVMHLGAIKPAQWFADYPQWTAKLEEVMGICEAEAQAQATRENAQASELDGLRAELAELKAELKKVADTRQGANKQAATADEAEAEQAAEDDTAAEA